MPVEDTYARRRHAFLVRTRNLRQLLVFITRKNASLTLLARLIMTDHETKVALHQLATQVMCMSNATGRKYK